MKKTKEHINYEKKTHHSATFSTSNLMWIGFDTEPCLPCLCYLAMWKIFSPYRAV